MNEMFKFKTSDNVLDKPVDLLDPYGRDYSNQVPMYFPVCSIIKNDTIDPNKIVDADITLSKINYDDGVERVDHTDYLLSDMGKSFNPLTVRSLGFEGDSFMHDPLMNVDRADFTTIANGCILCDFKSSSFDEDLNVEGVKVYLSVIRANENQGVDNLIRDDIPLYYLRTPSIASRSTLNKIERGLCGLNLDKKTLPKSYEIFGQDIYRSYRYYRFDKSDEINAVAEVDFSNSSEDRYLGLKLCCYKYIYAAPPEGDGENYATVYPVSYDEMSFEDFSNPINIDEDWSDHDNYFNANEDYFNMEASGGGFVFEHVYYNTAYFLIHKVDSGKFDDVSTEESEKYPEIIAVCRNYNTDFNEDSPIDGALFEVQVR